MDENQLRRREEISDFAVKLRELVKTAPDGYAKRDLNRSLHNLRQRYGTPKSEKKKIILEKISDGLTTLKDLVDETGFSRGQTQRSLSELQQEEKIRIEKIRRNEKGQGRYQVGYFPV